VKYFEAIEISSPGIGWKLVCADADRLARDAARAALADGAAAMGLAWQARLELGIMLTDDAHQRQLNRTYRGQNIPTNVLAFPAWKPGTPPAVSAPVLLGDVVLAFETVAREAGEQGKPFANHFRHLIVHGVLHLLGCDHRTETEAAVMERLEITILAKLGIPDPYHGDIWSIERGSACP
jgi:probable rRNA maturation factor